MCKWSAVRYAEMRRPLRDGRGGGGGCERVGSSKISILALLNFCPPLRVLVLERSFDVFTPQSFCSRISGFDFRRLTTPSSWVGNDATHRSKPLVGRSGGNTLPKRQCFSLGPAPLRGAVHPHHTHPTPHPPHTHTLIGSHPSAPPAIPIGISPS